METVISLLQQFFKFYFSHTKIGEAYRFENRTISTATFPKTAKNITSQTDPLNQSEPITSSQGFNASGTG